MKRKDEIPEDFQIVPDEYISVSQMAEREGLSRQYVLRVAIGGKIWRNGKQVMVKGKLRYGKDYIRKGERVYINDRIRLIRGKIIKE